MNKENDFLKKILSIMPGNIYWKDRNGIYRGCNENLVKIHGLNSTENIIGKDDHDLLDKNLADVVCQTDNYVMNSGKEMILEERGFSADKSPAIYITYKVPIIEGKKVIGMAGISFDITDKKRTEQELKEARIRSKLQEERIQTIKAVGAGIAHELRTPIRSIIASGEGIKRFLPILLRGYDLAKDAGLAVDPIYPQQAELLHTAADLLKYEGAAANTIVDMLLMNIKEIDVDEGKFRLLSMRDCVNIALKRYPFQASERQLVNWDENLSDVDDFKFKGDEILIIHVIFNLMKNALYYIAKAGKGEVFILLKKSKNKNQLIFKDTGKGIETDILPRIFERFFSRTEYGAGIGLSFCQMAIRRMGGDIDCKSKEGKFTKFYLTFPTTKK